MADTNNTMDPKTLLRQDIAQLHDRCRDEPPSMFAFLLPKNRPKNRDPQLAVYDHSRVHLTDGGDDYYHASYVDSYEQEKGYVLAQAPFNQQTEVDFWRMSMQLSPRLIVVLSPFTPTDGSKELLRQFWPSDIGSVNVTANQIEKSTLFDVFELILSRNKTNVHTTLLQYKEWTRDAAVPDSLLSLIAKMRQYSDTGRDGTVVLVCATGVHRSGTVAVIDTVLARGRAYRRIGLPQTVKVMRRQRYGIVDHFEHYRAINEMIITVAILAGWTVINNN